MDPARLETPLRQVVQAIGTARAVHDVRPVSAYVAASVNESRFMMLVLGGFAAAAVVLAAIGLYATLSHLIAARRQEFGVRLALGATPDAIVRLVAREGALLTATGAIVGAGFAIAVPETLAGMLYGVTTFDARALISAVAVVSMVAFLAICHPAWRAARVDPNIALRSE